MSLKARVYVGFIISIGAIALGYGLYPWEGPNLSPVSLLPRAGHSRLLPEGDPAGHDLRAFHLPAWRDVPRERRLLTPATGYMDQWWYHFANRHLRAVR
jgi:hypothetical protein